MAQWTLSPEDAGVRLDKYLAASGRAGSRARAAAALERGKVFLNEREVSLADAATRLSAGDIVRLWADRPGSAKRPQTLGDDRDLPVLYEDDAVIVLNKPAGPAGGAAAAAAALRRAVGVRRSEGVLPPARTPAPVRRASHRSRHVRAGAVRQKRTGAGDAERSVQAASARAHLPGGRLRPPVAARGHVARSPRLGSEGADSEGNARARPARQGSDQPLPRDRAARGGVVDRSAPGDRKAESDSDPGAAAGPHPGRRTALHLRTGHPPDALRFRGRRSTRSGWRSAIRTTIARCGSRRRCPTTSSRSSPACAAARTDNRDLRAPFCDTRPSCAPHLPRPRHVLRWIPLALALRISQCGLRPADFGLRIPLRQSAVGTLQSAIRNPQSAIRSEGVSRGRNHVRRARSGSRNERSPGPGTGPGDVDDDSRAVASSDASIVGYLKTIAPDKQAIALIHALEVGVTEMLARRERFRS